MALELVAGVELPVFYFQKGERGARSRRILEDAASIFFAGSGDLRFAPFKRMSQDEVGVDTVLAIQKLNVKKRDEADKRKEPLCLIEGGGPAADRSGVPVDLSVVVLRAQAWLGAPRTRVALALDALKYRFKGSEWRELWAGIEERWGFIEHDRFDEIPLRGLLANAREGGHDLAEVFAALEKVVPRRVCG
jgi:hypothetical protein